MFNFGNFFRNVIGIIFLIIILYFVFSIFIFLFPVVFIVFLFLFIWKNFSFQRDSFSSNQGFSPRSSSEEPFNRSKNSKNSPIEVEVKVKDIK